MCMFRSPGTTVKVHSIPERRKTPPFFPEPNLSAVSVAKGSFFKSFLYNRLLCLARCAVGFPPSGFLSILKAFSPFSVFCLKVECIIGFNAHNVALRSSRIYAESLAKAGFRRLVAGNGNNYAVLSAVFVICINRIGKEKLCPKILKAFYVTGTRAENYKIFTFRCAYL